MKAFKPSPGRIATIVVVLLLIPALVVPLFELSERSQQEDLLRGAYQRQLDAILYSINQYALDVATGWAGTLASGLRQEPWTAVVDSFLQRTPAVAGVVVLDTTLRRIALSVPDTIGAGVQVALQRDRDKIDRLSRFGKLQYQKLEPVVLTDSRGPANVALTFVIRPGESEGLVAVLVLEPVPFIRRELAPRIQDAAGLEFVLSVEGPGGTTILVTDSTRRVEILQRKSLWVFPDLMLGIGLQGTTLEDLLAARFRRNLIFIVILDMFLLGGAWFAYRSIRAESRLAAARSTFVSNVSHELRTPLSLIRMYAETLDMGRLKDEKKKQEYYGTIVRETERLTRLVNNILNFSRIEAGKRPFRQEPVVLNEVVAAVLETYGPHYRRQGFDPQTDLDPVLPTVPGDRESVTEALINLVENAVKYSGDSRYLCFRTGQSDDGVFVEVEDRGIGIAPEHQRKIFDTFYRVPTGLVHDTRGSGLGLTLVRRIMEAHGGSVSVRSAVGKGSTFRLWFPCSEQGRS